MPPTTNYQPGFTLIEILVTIGIIVLVSTITLPNLRQFSEEQKIEAAASDFIQTLKRAQSGARSGIKCKTSSSIDWLVNTSTNTYNLKSNCANGSLEERKPDTPYYQDQAGTVTKFEDSCLGNGDLVFILKGNEIKGKCGDDSEVALPLYIIVKDKTNTKLKILVEGSGLITKQDAN